MAVTLSVIAAKDGAGATIVGGVQAIDLSGAGTGPWSPGNVIIDGALGVLRAKVGSTSQTMSAGFLLTALASDSPGVTPLGQAVMTSSLPVTMASNQSTFPVKNTERFFDIAATTLTRPANTTQYSNNDSVSNNGTAGSVTALSATVSDTNDAPILISEIILDTNDTGIGAATVSMRVYLYNSDPTANSGVVAGDNAAFSNKRAGLVGTFVGTFTAMQDGGKCRCVPEAGSYIICNPTSGAETLFVQHQITAGAPTPSANSTTIISNIRGIQGRA